MPRVRCNRCQKNETVLRAGFIRDKQRYYCKECDYHFTQGKSNEKNKKSQNHATTIIDVANALGISPSTVSRALKDHPDLSEKTKNAVKKMAESLNYHPNALAQSLTNRETRTIGVIIPDIETYFFSSILTGIQNVASEAGYKVMISQSKESHKTEVANTYAFMANWADGLLICHSKHTKTFDHIKLLQKSGIPIVHFDRVCEEAISSKVLLDDVNGSFVITDHLIKQGCKRILLISGPEHLYVSKKREEGYKKALAKNKISFDSALISNTDLTTKSILQAVDKKMENDESIDAIFSISDYGAVKIIMHLKSKKIKIPEKVCVAGFGGEPMGEIIEPGLTTFNPQTYKIGETVARLFLDQIIEGSDFVPKTKVVKGHLIIRGSSSRKQNT